jgi:hypothetical protein
MIGEFAPLTSTLCRSTIAEQETFEKDVFSKVNRSQQRSVQGARQTPTARAHFRSYLARCISWLQSEYIIKCIVNSISCSSAWSLLFLLLVSLALLRSHASSLQHLEVYNAGDIVLFNDVSVLYKRVDDLIIAVTGSQDENEVILCTVLTGLSEALSILLRFALLLHHPNTYQCML